VNGTKSGFTGIVASEKSMSVAYYNQYGDVIYETSVQSRTTSSTTTTTSSTDSSSSSSLLGASTVAAIVIGTVVGVGALMTGVYYSFFMTKAPVHHLTQKLLESRTFYEEHDRL
jgi:hypothetical protein